MRDYASPFRVVEFQAANQRRSSAITCIEILVECALIVMAGSPRLVERRQKSGGKSPKQRIWTEK